MTRRSKSRSRERHSGRGPATTDPISRVTRVRPLTKLRTISETAEILQTSSRTVQRLIACGKLRAHRIGRLVRIEDADIAGLLDATGSE
jgi:excisionase family DNA binding protein